MVSVGGRVRATVRGKVRVRGKVGVRDNVRVTVRNRSN